MLIERIVSRKPDLFRRQLVSNAYRQFRSIASQIVHFPTHAKRNADFRRAKRILCAADLTASEIWMLRQVSLKVSPSDMMYGPKDRAKSYLGAGLLAIRYIQAALEAAGQKGPIKSILDFPCGHGRVMRFLKIMFPDAVIVGGEIDSGAVDFCKRTFSAVGFVSTDDFAGIALQRKFDLIWCGSLITHIKEESTVALLDFFYRHLKDGGTCVFTTHGELIRKMIETKEGQSFLMAPGGEEQLLRDYKARGYGFANYRAGQKRDLGTSLTSHARIVEMAQAVGTWKETLYLEHGWHSQDVCAFTKR